MLKKNKQVKRKPKLLLKFVIFGVILIILSVPMIYLSVRKYQNSNLTSTDASAAAEREKTVVPEFLDSTGTLTNGSLKTKSYSPSSFPSLPTSWKHLAYSVGSLDNKTVYRQAFATGLSPFYASDGINPNNAVYSKRFNKTFIAYPGGYKRTNETNLSRFYADGGSSVNPYIISYDHGSGRYEGPYKLANLGDLNDQHNYPIITEDADGYLHVLYSYHGTLQSASGNFRNITQFISKKPGDISEWNIAEIPGTEVNTYSQIIKDRQNKLHVFYRRTEIGATGKQNYSESMYVSSADNGRTWSKPRPLIQPPRATQGSNGPIGWNTIYMRTIQLDPYNNRIWLTFRESKWHNEAVKRYFIAYYNIQDNKLYTASGQDLGPEITYNELENNTILKELQFFSYDNEHLQAQRFASGKDILLYRDQNSVPDLLITRYYSPHTITDSNSYYGKGYYQPNRISFNQSNGWQNKGVPKVFEKQQVYFDASYVYGSTNYIAYKQAGTIDDSYQLKQQIQTYIGRVTNFDTLEHEKVGLFAEDQQSWLANGSSYVGFVDGSRDKLMAVTMVPKYTWWMNAKDRNELMSLSEAKYGWYGFPPIGAAYLVMFDKGNERIDSKSESSIETQKFCALTSSRRSPQCTSWESMTINGCTLADWQAKRSTCKSTSAGGYSWLYINNKDASHMRFINVKPEIYCDKVSETDPGWSPWEEIANYKHWKMDTSASSKKVCVQFATRCSNNNAELRSPICGAVTN